MKKNKKISISFFICIAIILCILLSGIRPMIVMSGSMEPAIKTGSVCFVNTKASFEKVQIDDIITYRLLDSYITHRVVNHVDDDALITKGDANNVEDLGVITKENYYGKVIGHIPYIGYAVFFIRKNIVFTITIIVIITIGCNVIRKILKKEADE